MTDTFTAHEAEIAAIVARYDLTPQPVALHVRGLNGGIDYGRADRGGELRFGTLYRVTQAFGANRSGGMDEGQEAYFMGYYVFPYDGGLRLYFETEDGRKFDLEFEQVSPAGPGELDRMRAPSEYFAAHEDARPRATALAEARAEIEALQAVAGAERDAAHEAARPPRERHLAAAIKTFDLPDLPSYAYVTGGAESMDYAHLRFGRLYRVIQPIASNRGDVLSKGQVLRFVGAYTSEAYNSLGLYFESGPGQTLRLWFEPDAPQTPDTRRYFRDPEAHLRPVLFDLSKRRKQLVAARAVLLHLRNQGDPS